MAAAQLRNRESSMSEEVLLDNEKRVGVQHASLRSPRSYPELFDAASIGKGRGICSIQGNCREDMEKQNGFAGYSSADAMTSGPHANVRATPTSERKQRGTLDNIMSLGNDPEFFNMIKPVSRSTSCHNCGLHGSRRCSQCQQTYYCSVECQKQDWKAHSVFCKPAMTTKGPDGDKSSRGRGNTKVSPKPKPCAAVPEFRNFQEDVRKITLRDLQETTLSEGMEMQGYVVEFSSPSNFFVQFCNATSLESLAMVSRSLKNVYSNPENVKRGYTPDIGEVCVAKFSQDQQWYRVLVHNLEMTTSTAQVLYLDYGNVETLKLDDFQPMHKDVELLPPSAVNCCIAHVVALPIGWTSECLIDVKRLLVGQRLSFRIVHLVQEELPRYTVDVWIPDSGEHVHKIMLEKGYSFTPLRGTHVQDETSGKGPAVGELAEMSGQKQGELSKDSPPPIPQVRSMSASVGDRLQAVITVIHNPETFFCQQVQNAKQLAELMTSMNERYSTMPITPGFMPAPGEICAAQFTEDSNWYRASVVKHIADDSVLVGYLDFGNAEALNISRLRHIDADMLSIPFQAAQCCLAGVKPPSGTWTSEASQALGVLTMNKIITAAVVSESSGILTMDLIDESITPNIFVSKHLIEAGLAVPDTSGSKSPSKTQASLPGDSSVQLKWAELPLGQVTEVVVCMLRNPGEFFCHICNQTDLNLLDELNTALGKYCKDHTSEDYRPVREEVCAAFYTGDGNWYRGQVKDFAPDGVTKFLFLDYGNLENVPVEKLCKIPPSFLELPFQAMCCSLAGVKPPGDQWDKQAAETFQKSVVGIKLKAKAVGHTKHGYSVELVACETANVITDVLLAEGAAVRDDGKVGKTAMGTGLSPVQERANMVNDSLKSHRDLLITRDIKMPPLTQRESHSTPCTSPADSTKSSLSFQRELLSTNCRPSAPTELRPPDAISLSPKDFNSGNATPSVYRELNSTNSTPSAQSALRSPISTLSMTESLFASPPMPRENPACSPTTLRPKDLRSANSTPPARNELRSPNYSPSLPKEPFSTKCSPPVSRQLGSTSSTPPAQSALRPPISTLSTTESLFASPPMPRENPACSPTTLRPRDLRSANSTPPARNELRSPNYSPSLPKEPFSTKCSPPVSRQLGSTSSTPPAQSALRPPISTLSTTESLFASPPMPRENPACSPTTLRPRDLRSANSTPPARNELRSPNYSPSLPKEPFSTKCSPPASRQLGSTNSTPSAERDLYSSANKQRPPVLQETLSCNNSANRRSPVIQDTSGVCIARRWESVDLPLNEALPACVLNVISPDLFYVFPKENRVNVGRLQQVMMDIFTHCSAETEQHSYKPLVGDACCAKFTADGQWYRAVVLEVSETTVKIVYADYGNMESLPFSCLLPIKENFLNPPMQITKCSLADVIPVTEQWSPEATQALRSLLVGAEVSITALSVTTGTYSVSVEKVQETGPIRLSEKLITDGLARCRPSMPVTRGCPERGGCCCRDLQKRVEKLELILLSLLKEEKMK